MGCGELPLDNDTNRHLDSHRASTGTTRAENGSLPLPGLDINPLRPVTNATEHVVWVEHADRSNT